jgi:O-methyltransferase
MSESVLKDKEFYRTGPARFRIHEDVHLFSPWLGYGEFGEMFRKSKSYNLYKTYFIHCALKQALNCSDFSYEVWECGVYKGETARFLAAYAERSERKLRLFDTYTGMPKVDATRDTDLEGMFADTSVEQVRQSLAFLNADVSFEQGLIPDTFTGHDDKKIAFAHIDLDIYWPIREACEFIYPKLPVGGGMVFDDYGWHNCPGAREAVDEFFSRKKETIVVLPTGQAYVTKIG